MGKDINTQEKRKNFWKCLEEYILNNNNRLCVLNPLKKLEEKENYYKIPYEHEKDIIINDIHSINNHSGRDLTYQNILKKGWYLYWMVSDINNFIKLCPNCNTSNKFKKLKVVKKIIIESGPHYRYIADLWQLPKDISKDTGYKYILDIVDHFSKWYYGYLLKSKEGEEVLKKNRDI